MNIDKHDLFRNVFPGYVFLIVILSFYAVRNALDSITAVEAQKAVLAVFAGIPIGFPLGFIIQTLYRIVFHVWTFGFWEQNKMEEEDANIIQDALDDNGKAAVNKLVLNYKDNRERNKALSQLISLFQNQQANKGYMDRINFLISNAHALGASALAIFMALMFILSRKYPIWNLHLCAWNNADAVWVNLLFVFWFGVIIVFYMGRKGVRSSYRIAKDVLVKIEKAELAAFLSKSNGTTNK